MFKKLQKRLTLLYTCSIGTVLTLILALCFFYMQGALFSKNEASFSSLFLNISSQFQLSSSVSDSWLAQMELENRLLISIEENQKPLLFQGAWLPSTDRETLFSKSRKLALKYQVPSNVRPVTEVSKKTPVFSISGSRRDHYLGMLLVSSTSTGYKSILVLQDITSVFRQVFFMGCFFLAVDLLGIFLLFLASGYAVGKTLKPLKENQKKQAEFIAAASHELRSPLAVIQASASAARSSSERAPDMLDNIEKECSRMGSLLKDLLLLASSDSKGWTLSLSPADPDTLLLEVYETFSPLCRQKGFSLTLDLPDCPLPKISCDRDRLIQILTILLNNAMSYTRPGQAVELKLTEKKGAVCFYVTDHGPGIPENEKPFIFDRFYQSDKSRSKKDHFGLGLAVARELALLHRGELALKDTPQGGCTFLLKIPSSGLSQI